MLVQDQMTGYVSEVPDHLYGYEGYYGEYPDHIGESQMLYDGLGNPVGLFPAIAALAAKALPIASSLISKIPGVGKIFGGGGRPGRPPLPLPLPIPIPRPGMPGPVPPPMPRGWIRPPLPYTGLGPRRLYMRCAVWPGPRGLVPASAATALPAPGTPAAAAAQAAAATAAAVAGRRRRGRRRR
jgi:hypothetical protein